MEKKNYLFLFVILLFASFIMSSCDKDNDPIPEPTPWEMTFGALILSSGSQDKNNSTLDFYDFETGELNQNVFKAVNGRDLGSTANDMIIYGSKIYIAIDQSGIVDVIDFKSKSGKMINMKNADGKSHGPRYLVAHKGKVYVSTSAGFVAQIDTAYLTVEKTVQIGSYLEQLCVNNEKLYVTVSGWGADNKVVSVDIPTFEVVDTLEVALNPTMIQADDQGMLYVLSSGNYVDIKKTLQRLNPATGESSVLLVNDEISISREGDFLYVISATVDPVTWIKTSTDYKKYNLKSASFEGKDFVNADVAIENATYAFADPTTDQLYVTAGDFVSTGDIHIISKEGALVKKVPVSGINPVCVRFIDVNR